MSTELTPFAEITTPRDSPRGALSGVDPTLGRLSVVSDWFADRRSTAGVLTRPRVLVVGGDHGPAGAAASHEDPGVGQRLALAQDVGWVRIDVATHSADTTSDDVICAGHPDAATADVLTPDQAVAAVELGRRLADREVDAGADLLIPGLTGSGHELPLGALCAILTGLEPVDAVTVPDSDPAVWMAAVTTLRDALFRIRDRDKDVLSLLAAVGGADLGVLAGLLAQAAVRRTPVLLDGLPATVAAVLAHRLAPGADAWFIAAGQATGRPGRRLQDMLGLPLVAALDTDSPTGVGAVLLLPLIQSALAVCADRAQAGGAGEVPVTAGVAEPQPIG